MIRYRVTAPYITLKVRDHAGAVVLGEFYQGALLPDSANEADRDRLVGKGMVAEVEVADEAEAQEAAEAGDPNAEAPETEPPTALLDDDKPPAGNASRDAWAAWAAKKDAPDEETRAPEDGGLSRDQLREKYGS